MSSPDHARALASARQVLDIERRALKALGEGLDDAFPTAFALLAGTVGRGRVIVTGIGKSGHVARKIAATLASTGTPSLFVHAGEASHGDLGMIVSGDCVLALSNSGETAELAAIIDHARRRDIPLVAITGDAGSTLAQRADAALILPRQPEACPMGLAPTTSTTMMLALGDALAVALLEARGFTAEDFQSYHPGGRLGRLLVSVEALMHAGNAMPLVPEGTAMAEALIVMSEKGFGCVGITGSGGRLSGIVTDGDLRRHMGEGLLDRAVETVMTPQPKVIGPTTLASDALRLMHAGRRPITALFVVDSGQRPLGLLHVHDLLRAGLD